jgi:hypothetical protein
MKTDKIIGLSYSLLEHNFNAITILSSADTT